MRLINTPRSVDLDITTKCNLRCSYCFHFTSPADVRKDLSTHEWLKFFEELNRCQVMNVCLQGGEPFCRQDLPVLIEGIVKNRMRFSILSNGTLITDELAGFIASTRRCDSIQVSIDGSQPSAHDAVRGEGSFLKAINGIRVLQKNNIALTVRVTINRKNVHELDKIAKFLLEEIKLPSFSTNCASFMGMCRTNSKDLQLTIPERVLAMEELMRLNSKYNGRIQAQAGPLSEAKEWSRMIAACQNGKKGISGRGFLSGCGGVNEKLAVRADGVIVPCIMLSHIELGFINKDDLRGVWQNHSQLKRLRERVNIRLDSFDFCNGCEYIPFCTGNCPGTAYSILGKDDHPSPDACLKKFLEAGGKLPQDKQVNFVESAC